MLILNDTIGQDLGDEVTEMLDTITSKSNTLIEVEDAVFVQEALSLLTPQQQKVFTATVLEGRTEQEVAEQLERSQPVVHRLKQRALKRLKKNFVLDEPIVK